MFDAKSLLNQLLGAEAATKWGGVIDQISDGQGALLEQAKGALTQAAQPGGLGQLAGQATDFFGKAKELVSEEASALANGGKIEDTLAHGKSFVQANTGAVLGTLAAGTLATILLGTKGGRVVTGKVVKLGGMALIGALAHKAFLDWQQGNAGAAKPAAKDLLAAPAGTQLAPQEDDAQQALARLALKAMIAAAASDGTVDEAERARILWRVRQVGLDAGAQAFLEAQIANPASIADLKDAVTSPELAAAVYASSLLAIDVDAPTEDAYLKALATALGVDDALASQLASEVEALRAQDHAS